jgi:hypothetical protein
VGQKALEVRKDLGFSTLIPSTPQANC